MARPRERTELCLDLGFNQEVKGESDLPAYRNLRTFADISGVPYDTVLRVVNGKPCTGIEEQQVRQAWARFSPDAIYELAEAVLDPLLGGVLPKDDELRELRAALHRVMGAVTK
jgi:hypothetical protein